MATQQQREVLSQALEYVLGTDKAIVLPSFSRPKLIVPLSSSAMRWKLCSFFPAFKLKAQLWRLLQRVRCITGLAPVVSVENDGSLRSFLDEILLGITHSSVLLGTPGPDQKLIVQLWKEGRVAAYLKVAIGASADQKIAAEGNVLEQLPQGLGPRLLKRGVLNGRAAIVISPVQGTAIPAKLPGPSEVSGQISEVREYLDQLKVSDELFDVDEHPAIIRLRQQVEKGCRLKGAVPQQLATINKQLDSLLEPLRMQRWPVVIQHGDFAPWNVLRVSEEKVIGYRMEGDKESPTTNNRSTNNFQSRYRAIDWEEGCLNGFPCFDLIHYVSQTAALVEKWSPEKCARYLMSCLADLPIAVRKPVVRLGLLASWLMLRRTLDEDHWILDWKEKAWRAIDEL